MSVIEQYALLFHLAAWFGGWAVAMVTVLAIQQVGA